MTLTPVFYRTIDAALPLANIVGHAHVLGYELVPFEGYATGTLGRRNPAQASALENWERLQEILDTVPGLGTYTVDQMEVGVPDREPMDEDDAVRIARANSGDSGWDGE
jgi:hypothetical protein